MPTELLGVATWKVIGAAGAILAIFLIWLGWRMKRWWSSVQLGARRRRGARGEAAVDLHAIADALQRISQLVTDFPQIDEMDINPFIVGEVGTQPVVADARMILSGV